MKRKWKCLSLGHCNPMDRSLPGSFVRGILLARILEWVATPFPKPFPSPGDLPNPEIRTEVSCIAGRFFTVWTTRKALKSKWKNCKAWRHSTVTYDSSIILPLSPITVQLLHTVLTRKVSRINKQEKLFSGFKVLESSLSYFNFHKDGITAVMKCPHWHLLPTSHRKQITLQDLSSHLHWRKLPDFGSFPKPRFLKACLRTVLTLNGILTIQSLFKCKWRKLRTF